jgi:hypothetical protein
MCFPTIVPSILLQHLLCKSSETVVDVLRHVSASVPQYFYLNMELAGGDEWLINFCMQLITVISLYTYYSQFYYRSINIRKYRNRLLMLLKNLPHFNKIREHWVFGLYPSSTKSSDWRHFFLTDPHSVGVSHPFSWRQKQIQFTKRCVL